PARLVRLAGRDYATCVSRRSRSGGRSCGVQVIPRPHVDWFALAPVNALLAASALALLSAVLVPRSSRKPTAASLCALGYAVAFGFASAVLLFGSALVYGATGVIDFPGIAAAGRAHDTLLLFGLAMILAGLGFKASAAPFHMWTPDVYEGAPTPVTAFMSAATKTV